MRKWLNWIDDEVLLNICKNVISEGTRATQDLSYENVVDPFSAIFDVAISDISLDDWVQREIRRQQQKTLQNAIGKFHQLVLGSVKGWEDLRIGKIFDLRNTEKKILAEVKNKYNTVTGKDRSNLYKDMVDEKAKYPEYADYTIYFVQILTKKGRIKAPFTPSDRVQHARLEANNKILEIDGKSFYAEATGSPTALDDLYLILPEVLEKAVNKGSFAKDIRKSLFFNTLLEKLP